MIKFDIQLTWLKFIDKGILKMQTEVSSDQKFTDN